MNAIIGDNGIITRAQEANFESQRAVLQDYINEFYVEHFEDMEDATNRISALQTIDSSRDWIYKGKLGYVVDSDGYVHYFLIIENFPKEIKNQIKYGIGEKKYSDYVNCKDVWGITEDLQVYYCKDGQKTISGVQLGSLSQENGADEVFKSGSALAKKLKGNDTENVTKADLRGIKSFTLDASTEMDNLNEIYKFSDLTELIIQDLNLTSLDGIEYLPKLQRLHMIRSTSEDYSSLRKIPEQISYLFFENTENSEIEKFCSYDKGVGCKTDGSGGADFINLSYFGIFGKVHWEAAYWTAVPEGNISNEACFHSKFNNISYLSNLSKVTKEKITNLFLNNNSLETIDNLWEFKNVMLLRIEANNLVNLDGLVHAITDTKDVEGMINLQHLLAYSNRLGQNEGDTLDIKNDGLSIFSDTTYDEHAGVYKFVARFEKLSVLNLNQNKLKFLNYLGDNKNLTSFSFALNQNLNLDLGVGSILNILENPSLSFNCDDQVREYIANNSKLVNKIQKNNVKMTVAEFKTFFSGREENLRYLELTNFVLTDDKGVELSDKTTPTFNESFSDVMNDLTGITCLYLNNIKNLTDISFVKNMSKLLQIDLRGCGVSDLKPLVDNCPDIYLVIVDNENINVANVADESGMTEITEVEKLFNKVGNTCGKGVKLDSFRKFIHDQGLIFTNMNLIKQLENSTNISSLFTMSYFGLR